MYIQKNASIENTTYYYVLNFSSTIYGGVFSFEANDRLVLPCMLDRDICF